MKEKILAYEKQGVVKKTKIVTFSETIRASDENHAKIIVMNDVRQIIKAADQSESIRMGGDYYRSVYIDSPKNEDVEINNIGDDVFRCVINLHVNCESYRLLEMTEE